MRKKKLHLNSLFGCTHTCCCVSMVSVKLASSYVTPASRYQSRSSMYIRGLIPLSSTELAEAVPIEDNIAHTTARTQKCNYLSLSQRDDYKTKENDTKYCITKLDPSTT